MRLHRFYIQTASHLKAGGRVVLTDANIIHQWKRVFRFGPESEVVLFDGSGSEYKAKIISLKKDAAEVEVEEERQVNTESKKEVWLYAALIKKDHFEWIVEKGTELGVAHFVPIISERSEKKNLNIDRLKKIAQEAAEQSGRVRMPIVHDVVDLKTAVEEARVPLAAFHMEGDLFRGDQEKTGLLVGPEGGWTDDEIKYFTSKNISIYSLGPRVLRAETAAVVVSALALL